MAGDKLFHIQDADRPMHVVALDYNDALRKWKLLLADENECEAAEIENPQGIAFVADDDELIL